RPEGWRPTCLRHRLIPKDLMHSWTAQEWMSCSRPQNTMFNICLADIAPFFFVDAVGITRYLPVFIYPKGSPDKAAFIGHYMENFQHEVTPFWTPEVLAKATGSVDAMQKAIDYVKRSGVAAKCIGIEMAFLPTDAETTLRKAMAGSETIDALFTLERLRA